MRVKQNIREEPGVDEMMDDAEGEQNEAEEVMEDTTENMEDKLREMRHIHEALSVSMSTNFQVKS